MSMQNKDRTIDNGNTTTMKSSDEKDMSLSRYLHSAVFDPILDTNKSASDKFQPIHRINSFLSGQQSDDSSTGDCDSKAQAADASLFSPLVSDVHLAFHRPEESQLSKSNLSTSRSSSRIHSIHKDGHAIASSAASASAASAAVNNNIVVGINSGIQLPVIDWHREFRKGYSMLMWVRLHQNHNDTGHTSDIGGGIDGGSDIDNTMTSKEQPEPQLLYRFATSASPMSNGVQATLHRDTSKSSKASHDKIPVIIRIETLRPASPSKIDNIHSVTLPNSLTTKPILLPNNQWSLICIQHSFPYLKRPLLTLSINGVEVDKTEMTYPTLGGDAGDVMMDNYLLCNIPPPKPKYKYKYKSSTKSSSHHNSGNSVLQVDRVDFAGFGLFKQPIPTLLQAIICEHGPCPSADGVIPAVPPVVQAKDGIVTGAAAGASQRQTAIGIVGSIGNQTSSSSSTGIGTGTTSTTGLRSPRSKHKHNSMMVSSGPFGLSSHRMTNASEGRGIGIPLCTGVQLTDEVSHKGDLFLQQLLSKLVLGLNGSGVFQYGNTSSSDSGVSTSGVSTSGSSSDSGNTSNSTSSGNNGRIGIEVKSGCSIGLTSDVKMVGIIQAKVPNRKHGDGGRRNGNVIPSIDDQDGTMAKTIGNVSIYHATKAFLDIEQDFHSSNNGSNNNIPLPSYKLPSSIVAGLNPMPSFVSTYMSLDPVSYILQPFHLALPPPGYTHSLQESLYHDSFDHLYDLVVDNGGALAAKLIDLFVTNLSLGGRVREEIIHRGGIHTLVVLLRRVLLRASRLGIISCKERNNTKKRLWKVYSIMESSRDELQDVNGQKETAPSYIPPKITMACQSLITACCGPVVDIGKRWKRPPLAVHIRRTSDIAMTAVFGLVLDLDLWGGDPVAAASIMQKFVDLYCSGGFGYKLDPPELTEKYDSGYGRLLRGQISIQHLLDLVRLRFGNEIIVQKNGGSDTRRMEALKSLSSSLSKLFYVLLKYSLFKQVSQGEHDISAIVGALSDCPLGSVGAHIVLTALKDILIYCEIVPKQRSESAEVDCDEDFAIRLLMEGTNSYKNMSMNSEQSLKLTRIKSEIAGRLARNLLMGQFHDVVAPMLLSRTVFDGRRTIVESGSSQNSREKANKETVDEMENGVPKCLSFEWQNHWIATLQIFIWLSSVARSEGDKVAHTTGNLLLQSGQAGSLSGCLLHLGKADYVSLLAPLFSTLSSALTPGGSSGKESHFIDTANRLKIIYQLMGGLVASLVSSHSESRNDNETHEKKRPKLLLKSALYSLEHFISVVLSMILYIQDRDIDPGNDSRRRRHVISNSTLEKTSVKTALGAVPSLVLVAVLIEDQIQVFKREYSTDGSWDFVEDNESNSNNDRSSLDEQLRVLTSCQTHILQIAALLTVKAMVVGGGEASTIILRDVVSNLNSLNPNNPSHDNSDNDNSSGSSKEKNHLLCRLISLVLNKIVARADNKDDPWKSVELCSATARLCDLVEEKKLLQCFHEESDSDNNGKLSLDQARLLCALLDVMEAGRENTGWCQIVLSGSVTDQHLNFLKRPSSPSKERKPSLIEILCSPAIFKTMKYIDYEVLARNEQIYHLIDNDNLASYEIFNKRQSSRDSTNPQSFSTSKLLLPILQPSLRIVLGCLGDIRSAAMVQYTSGNGGKSLLSILIEELRSTLTAALVGLAFPHARDLCLSALSLFRKGIGYHEQNGDEFVAIMYRDLFVTVVKEMHVRYEGERKKREVAELFSYDSPDSPEASPEAANSQEVENLLLGNSLVGSISRSQEVENESKEENSMEVSDDFILFPGGEQNPSQTPVSIGWNGYRGFGSALEKSIQPSSGGREDESIVALSNLSPYLDTWEEKQVIENEESELVELFDTNASTQDQSTGHGISAITGVATAADSMTSYIELASSETSRMSEIQTHLLPYKRYNCLSYSETVCWKSFFEIIVEKEKSMQLFERCMADAGRDYGGRLLTVPIHPQFARSIPKQLDNSLQMPSSPAHDDEMDLSKRQLSVDFDELNTLVQQGNLKIVDITKKSENEKGPDDIGEDELDESDNVLVSKPSVDSDEAELLLKKDDNVEEESRQVREDELYLAFPERSEEEENDLTVETKTEESSQQRDEFSISVKGVEENHLNDEGQSSSHTFFMSSFANPPNSTSSSLQGHLHHGSRDGSIIAGWGGLVEDYYDSCVHVKPEGNRRGTLLLTPTYLIFEYDDPTGLTESEVSTIEEMKKKSSDTDSPENDRNEYDRIIQHYMKTASLRPKSMRWNIHELSHVYLRRYRLRDSALEMFFLPSGGSMNGGTGLLSALSSIWLDFGPGNEGNLRRDDAANAIMKRAPTSTVKQWPEKSAQFLHEHLRNITLGWVKGRMNNFDYLLALNILSGRSFNDLCQYPVFPWVLSNYTSEEIPDLNDESNFRDLSKPMGALNPDRLEEFIERFQSFDDAIIPPFMYGSHYSTSAGVVLHFLVRMHPFASLHRQLQGGHFDVADRLFSSIARTWDMCTGQSAAEVKELTPEWYCNPSFLSNSNTFKLGTSQDGESLGDVILPPWANGSPEKFVEVLRCALESDICTKMLPSWIDLIFGRKQQGPAAVEAHNVFFYLTYYGSCDVASIEDEDLRVATELQIAHFGQCPMQLFWRPHVAKLSKLSTRRRLSLSELLGLYDIQNSSTVGQNGDSQLLFSSAPLEYWLHLSAPPPGPHAPIIAVRLVVPDRCLAVDAQGIFHFFRFGWKPNPDSIAEEDQVTSNDLFPDKGVFVAQRELPHFRSIPRLYYSTPKHSKKINRSTVVSISKCVFNRSLLVVSDGDGKGALCFQFVDPTKGVVDGEVLVPSVHSSRVSALHMDPIGAAAGVGGAGGELAIVGSEDGTATLWRFISNPICSLPLRPRLRLGGHKGMKVHSVAVSSVLHVCVTVSVSRCCVFGLSNGAILSSISVSDIEFPEASGMDAKSIRSESSFVDTNAVSLSASGFITLVCETKYFSSKNELLRRVTTLQLFTLEGVHVGSKALESWRGIPHRIVPTFDGRGIMVCSSGGVSIHLVSAIKPLYFVDEWRVANDDEIHSGIGAYDVDFGPSLSRPVVAVTGLSSGALRIHAFKGISEWSEGINKKSTVSEAVGNVLARPAEKVKGLFGVVKGKGSKVVGLGKEIGREAVSGFLGDVFGKKMEM